MTIESSAAAEEHGPDGALLAPARRVAASEAAPAGAAARSCLRRLDAIGHANGRDPGRSGPRWRTGRASEQARPTVEERRRSSAAAAQADRVAASSVGREVRRTGRSRGPSSIVPVGEVVVDVAGDGRVLGGLGLVDVDEQGRESGYSLLAIVSAVGATQVPLGSLETSGSRRPCPVLLGEGEADPAERGVGCRRCPR